MQLNPKALLCQKRSLGKALDKLSMVQAEVCSLLAFTMEWIILILYWSLRPQAHSFYSNLWPRLEVCNLLLTGFSQVLPWETRVLRREEGLLHPSQACTPQQLHGLGSYSLETQPEWKDWPRPRRQKEEAQITWTRVCHTHFCGFLDPIQLDSIEQHLLLKFGGLEARGCVPGNGMW